MRHRTRVHRVGLVTCSIGLTGLVLGSFGVFAPFRIATGQPDGLFEALPVPLAVLPVALWVLALAASAFGGHSRAASLARGWLAALLVVGVLWLTGVAADSAIEAGDTVARYSIGGGAWISMFAAFTLFMSGRREVGADTKAGLALSVTLPAALAALVASGALHDLGIAAEYRNVSRNFWSWVGLHLTLSAGAVLVAVLIATWLGVVAHRNKRIAEPLLTVTSLFQTIPGLAMIGILAVPLGMLVSGVPAVRRLGIGTIGWAPVAIALTLYALLVIARNTYAGLQSVPEATVEAGRGMGLSSGQILRKVQLPLAAPVLFSGIRTAVQQTIGNATLGVFVGAATLGRPIFGGVSQTADDLTLLGSVTLVVLALGSDIGLRGAEHLFRPRHMRKRSA
jgi:osmoprotectant transport system permease protein